MNFFGDFHVVIYVVRLFHEISVFVGRVAGVAVGSRSKRDPLGKEDN